MCSANKMLFVFLIHCWFLLFTETIGLELNRLDHQSSQHETKIFNHRFKRDGGTIPFRPLFVYRQQQKEKQAKWKLEAAQKLVQQEQFQLQSHQNAITDYNYRRDPVHYYYQSNPTYQPYHNYQYYPENSYEIYPYRTSGRLYFANEEESPYGKYDSEYYS